MDAILGRHVHVICMVAVECIPTLTTIPFSSTMPGERNSLLITYARDIPDGPGNRPQIPRLDADENESGVENESDSDESFDELIARASALRRENANARNTRRRLNGPNLQRRDMPNTSRNHLATASTATAAASVTAHGSTRASYPTGDWSSR